MSASLLKADKQPDISARPLCAKSGLTQLQQTASLFDHLVGASEQLLPHFGMIRTSARLVPGATTTIVPLRSTVNLAPNSFGAFFVIGSGSGAKPVLGRRSPTFMLCTTPGSGGGTLMIARMSVSSSGVRVNDACGMPAPRPSI